MLHTFINLANKPSLLGLALGGVNKRCHIWLGQVSASEWLGGTVNLPEIFYTPLKSQTIPQYHI